MLSGRLEHDRAVHRRCIWRRQRNLDAVHAQLERHNLVTAHDDCGLVVALHQQLAQGCHHVYGADNPQVLAFEGTQVNSSQTVQISDKYLGPCSRRQLCRNCWRVTTPTPSRGGNTYLSLCARVHQVCIRLHIRIFGLYTSNCVVVSVRIIVPTVARIHKNRLSMRNIAVRSQSRYLNTVMIPKRLQSSLQRCCKCRLQRCRLNFERVQAVSKQIQMIVVVHHPHVSWAYFLVGRHRLVASVRNRLARNIQNRELQP